MHYAGQVAMDRKPGRIGFMSTQRRENRSTPATNTCRRGPRYRWQRTSCTERAEAPGVPTPSPRNGRADASGRTAPPKDRIGMATNSLQSDRRTGQLVWQDVRRSSPPRGAGNCAVTSTPATHRSSSKHIPIPPGLAHFHFTLPQAPVGRRHRAESHPIVGDREFHPAWQQNGSRGKLQKAGGQLV